MLHRLSKITRAATLIQYPFHDPIEYILYYFLRYDILKLANCQDRIRSQVCVLI